MEFTLTTPALLFSAISLLLLAYTNRFLSLASLVRNLYSQYRSTNDDILKAQLENLNVRIRLIRNMQLAGVLSLFFCVLCMFVLFVGLLNAGKIIFGMALLLLLISLGLCAYEIRISGRALSLSLKDFLERPRDSYGPNMKKTSKRRTRHKKGER
ncbi:MAG: DUF2721 domain-containing protein [Leptospiraceae bacterium]|nr:DUF2721 domain-containing protein [Leptospiraceae bacterium]